MVEDVCEGVGGGGVVSCVKGKKERVKRKKMASMHPEHLDENTCIEMTKLTHSL